MNVKLYHGPGCTESNLLPPDTHYCLQGPSAMGNEYPVFLLSTSEPFSASLIDILKDNFGDGDLSEYVDVIQKVIFEIYSTADCRERHTRGFP